MSVPFEGGWPRLLLIADGFTDAAVAQRVQIAVSAGVRWVHLRDHEADAPRFAEAANALHAGLRTLAPNLWVSTNRHPAVASALGVGVHLGAWGPDVASVRRRFPDLTPVGYSAHTLAEAAEAARAGAHYVTLSPIFPTSSKPSHPGLGLDVLAAWAAALVPTPVYALGGITPARAAACLERGAAGVAVLSGILAAPDAAAAVQAYRTAPPPP